MSLVVGVDPSLTSAGVAILRDGQLVHTASPGFTDKGGGYSGKSWQLRNRRVRYQTRLIHEAAMSHGRPDLVVMEEHPYSAEAFGSEFDRSFLWGKIYEAFDWPEIPIVVINNQTLKMWVTGKGATRDPSLSKYQRQKQNKQRMVDTIKPWWPDWKFADGDSRIDECEAVALAAIGAHHLGDPLPFETKPRHRLNKITWPVIA